MEIMTNFDLKVVSVMIKKKRKGRVCTRVVAKLFGSFAKEDPLTR